MKQNVVKDLSNAELVERIAEGQQHLTKLKLNNAVTSLENPNKITEQRRMVARLKTELRKREISESLKK